MRRNGLRPVASLGLPRALRFSYEFYDAAALSAASAGARIALLPPPGAAPRLAPGDAYPESRTQSASWLDGCKSILTTITKPIRRVSHLVITGIVAGIKCIRMPKTAFARF